MNTSNGPPALRAVEEDANTRTSTPHEAEPKELQREIEQVRAQLDLLIRELDRRRHEMTDVKLQVRTHPLATVLVGAAGVLVIAAAVVSTYRALRPDPVLRRARKLARALEFAAKDPDRLLRALERRPDPRATLLSAILGAGTKAAARLPLLAASGSSAEAPAGAAD